MASVKELRLRIKSVGNIQQITRAMEMVASTKLRRFQDRAVASRPFTEEAVKLVKHLLGVLGSEVDQLPLFRKGDGDRIAVLFITSDRGLCGAYNSNLFHALEEWLRTVDESKVDFYVYGRKGYQYLTKRGRHVERFLVDPPLEAADYNTAAVTGGVLESAFLDGRYSDVRILHTAFLSMVKYEPRWIDFLPVSTEGLDEADSSAATDVILEPDAETIFGRLIPAYLRTVVYNVLLESLTSEYASRRVSMKAATDAANDMQKFLRGRYNRVRQESITGELLDIVGGAEAVK